jgi:site-specific recombinase XerC
LVNRHNYLLVTEYLDYLRDVSQLNPLSIERYKFYLKHLLVWADEAAFSRVAEIRPSFATHLTSARLDGGSGTLAPATLKKVIQTVKRFFVWLKMTYPREYRELPATWIDSLRPPRTVQAAKEHEFVSLDKVRQIATMQIDEGDLALRRDQAAVVMLFLSGMRAGAFCTLPVAAVDVRNRKIKQWPTLGVETKNGKSATTYLLDMPELLSVVEKWDALLRSDLPDTAMWYTPIISRWGEQRLSADAPGTNRSIGIVKRMRVLFAAADLPYKSPHKFRHGHAVYALQHADTMADYKAVSMNLMHEDIRVTDGIYAPLASNEVQQRISGLTRSSAKAVPASSDHDPLETLTDEQLRRVLLTVAHRLAR